MEDHEIGGSWVLIILFALIFGFGNGGLFGNNRSDFSQYATAASQQEILFGQQFQTLNQAINKVGDGLCSSTYALNNSIQGEGRAIQSQLAQCCCENQRNVDALRYDIAGMNAGLAAAIHGEGEQTRALINANEAQRLRDELGKAQLANSQFAQNNYLLSVMGKWVANPAST